MGELNWVTLLPSMSRAGLNLQVCKFSIAEKITGRDLQDLVSMKPRRKAYCSRLEASVYQRAGQLAFLVQKRGRFDESLSQSPLVKGLLGERQARPERFKDLR